MKCAVYTRVSTEDQEREGTSLDTQAEACLKKAIELGYEVPEQFIFREAYSGLTLDRPLLTMLCNIARDKEIGAVIIYTPDRLSRVGEDILSLAKELKLNGVRLHFVREHWEDTPNGKLVAFMLGWASEYEAAQLKERSIRGKRARAALGKLPSGTGRKLYGYDYIKGKGVGEGIRFVNEKEAKQVLEIFTWLIQENLTINGITRRLRALGVPTPGGSEFWLRQTVYRILTNPVYIGKTYAFTRDYVEPKRRKERTDGKRPRAKTGVIWKPKYVYEPYKYGQPITADWERDPDNENQIRKLNWVEIPGATPAIIPEELFRAAQKLLKRNKELSIRNARHQYLLSGYIFCRLCGARYIGYVKKWKDNGKPNEQRYYRCGKSQSIASPERCGNRQLNGPAIEGIVWSQIEALLTNPELILTELQRKEEETKKSSQQYTHWVNELKGLEAKLRNIEKQKDRAWRAFKITGDEARFRRDIAQADDDKSTLTEQRTSLEEKLKTFEQCQADIEGIKQACALVQANLKSLSFEDKRLALEALQIRVWVDRDNADIEGSIPIPKLPIKSSAARSSRLNNQSYPFLITANDSTN